MNSLHVLDIIVRPRREPRLYELRQVRARGEKFLEGPHRQGEAELRAIDLAKSDGADAWVEEYPQVLRLLTVGP